MQVLTSCLDANEHALARGRAYEPLDRDIQDLSFVNGPGWAVIVTDRRLLWTSTKDMRQLRTLPFDSVESYRELFQAHRYALVIQHGPIQVLHHVPKHRLLWWRWGNAAAIEPQTLTTLAFSRQSAQAAVTSRHAWSR